MEEARIFDKSQTYFIQDDLIEIDLQKKYHISFEAKSSGEVFSKAYFTI